MENLQFMMAKSDEIMGQIEFENDKELPMINQKPPGNQSHIRADTEEFEEMF